MKIQELQPEAKINAYYEYEQTAFVKAADIRDKALTQAKAVLAAAGAKKIRIALADTLKPIFQVIAFELSGNRDALYSEIAKIQQEHILLVSELFTEQQFVAWAACKNFNNEGDLI